MFKAVALMTPYFRLHDESLYKKLFAIKILQKVLPHHTIDMPPSNKSDEYMLKFGWAVNDAQ